MKVRVLVIDDDVLERLSAILDGEGYEVHTARTGVEASGILNKNIFSLLIIDARSPNVDSMKFLDHIKGVEPEPRKIVIVSPPTEENFRKAMLIGAHLCLGKPVDPETLLTTVRGQLEEHGK